MNPVLRPESGWYRFVDLSLTVAQLAVAIPCVPLMVVVGLLEPAARAPLDPKYREGLERARGLIARERLRHSVLSESFFVLTKELDELDGELGRSAPVSPTRREPRSS
jgi:hypothetical protein